MRAGCAVTSSVDVDELSSLYVQGRLLVGSTNSSRRFPVTVIAPAGASLNEEESHYASRVRAELQDQSRYPKVFREGPTATDADIGA